VTVRWRAALLVALASCLSLLPESVLAKKPPTPIRVASIVFKDSGRYQDSVVQECDVARIVSDAVQNHGAKEARKGGKKSLPRESVELSLRIDRLFRTGGQMQPRTPGGIELGVSVTHIGSKEVNQPFLCRTHKLFQNLAASNCGRIEWCSEKIAEQISTWVSWQAR
jgi:hypothetical protein